VVLSGTLREFILADVFQLLTQQRITGKLILNTGRSEGIVIFKNGIIVGAEKENEKTAVKLFQYLVEIKRVPIQRVRELFASNDEDFKALSKEILDLSVATSQEMHLFAESVVEDITCSLFQWKSGSYHFNSMKSVDHLIMFDTSIPVENIVMEAMRRFDEWNRMIDHISDNVIFVKAVKSETPNQHNLDPLQNTPDYLFPKVDGTSPVKLFYQNTCLTEYKVYEALNILLEEKKIILLPSQFSNSVQSAINKKTKIHAPYFVALSFSLILTAGLLIGNIFISKVLLNHYFFSAKLLDSYKYRIDLPVKKSIRNMYIALVNYQITHNSKPTGVGDLENFSLISKNDIYFYKLRAKVEYQQNNHYNKSE
jgi:hypothetical protein